MAGASLLMLIDDIASILQDVSRVSLHAIKQSVAVVGDDVALNSEQVASPDRQADRELPVVWAVAKGSVRNKMLLIPIVLAFSAWVQWAIPVLMVCGGAFLSYEGAEKLLGWISSHQRMPKRKPTANPFSDAGQHPAGQGEAKTIRGAIQTDFVLSAEILVLSLSVVASLSFAQQCVSLIILSLVMTCGVYGGVAVIVKLDDLGLWLVKQKGEGAVVGRWLLLLAPRLLKLISWMGMIAMFVVSGTLFFHHLALLHSLEQRLLSLDRGTGVFVIAAQCLTSILIGVTVNCVFDRLVQAWRMRGDKKG